MFDIADQWIDYDLAEEFVFDMFVVERGHLRVKTFAENHRDTSKDYEYHILKDALNFHCNALQTLRVGNRLLGKTTCFDATADLHLGRSLHFKGMVVHTGIIVLREDSAGLVTACWRRASDVFVAIDVLDKLADVRPPRFCAL